MRLLQVLSASNSGEAYKTLMEALQKENGSPITLERKVIVPMEEGAIDKLKRLSGNK